MDNSSIKNFSDAIIGPTNQCINADQFIALKKGDRFFYTNKKPGQRVFRKRQLEEIEKMKLAKVFCTQLGSDAMTLKHPFLTKNGEERHEDGTRVENGWKNEKIRCSESFPEKMNLDAWRESCKSSIFLQ